MAIYRGPGGAGDATADAASEASLIKDLAVEVQADADAAEAAKVAAQAAQAAAETAETNAETAETNAETAETNAETAQAAAASSASAAATSATNAANSATAAQTAETNAETAETNAETAETNAAASASAASTSATNASNSASAAATSATNASNSASAASTSATNASNSASAASTSATNAASSATSASGSATSAASSASTATTQAGIATTQASNAASSASAASTSASNAATSATNASNSASAASTSATNASNSASAASTSASNASSSEIAAAASAAAAAASYDSFDDRYLGAKSAAPTLDNDGNALVTGALYYNNGTVTPADKGMYVYDGTQWIAASAASTAILTVFKFTATGGQTTFSGTGDTGVSLSYTAGSVLVTLNGVLLEIPSEVTASSGTSVVLASGAVAGDELNVYAFSTFDIANVYTQAQVDATFLTKANPNYTGTLTGGTGVVNIGSGQFYKDSSGNVGIGTSSPNEKLEVVGSVGGGTSNSPSGTVILRRNGGPNANDYGPALTFAQYFWTGSTTLIGTGQISGVKTEGNGNFGGGLAFFSCPSGSGSFSERMRIDSSGNLLVGTTSQYGSAKLSVNGSIASGTGWYTRAGASGALGSNLFNIQWTGSAALWIDGTNIGNIQVSSDYRIKRNIETQTAPALERVMALRPVTYQMADYGTLFKATDDIKEGFIAHEVQEVIPSGTEGVKDDENQIQSLRLDAILAVAVKAIQEQQAQLTDMSLTLANANAIITDLKTELDSLKSEVTALKGQA